MSEGTNSTYSFWRFSPLVTKKETAQSLSFMQKVSYALGTGLVTGGVVGAVNAVWADTGAVQKGQYRPAVQATWKVIRSHAALFGAVAAVYAGVDAGLENVRGKKDFWNGVLGGCAAGVVLGARFNRIGLGVAASAGLAAMSLIAEMTSASTAYKERNAEKLSYARQNEND